MPILHKDFFELPTLLVAEQLLGKLLVVKRGKVETRVVIEEVEAYDGFLDMASHAHRGKTARNEIMFGPAGFWYVYLIYGMYWMLNVTTGPVDYPAAVLIRSVRTLEGKSIDGPGKITRFLGVGKQFNKQPAKVTSGLWIEDGGIVVPKKMILKTPRIGVLYAGPVWAEMPYRFLVSPSFTFSLKGIQ